MWLAPRSMNLILLLTAALATEEFLFPSRLPEIQEGMQTRLCQTAGVPYCSYNTPVYSDNDQIRDPTEVKISSYATAAEQPMLLNAKNADDLTRSENEADDAEPNIEVGELNPVKKDSAFSSWGGKRNENWNDKQHRFEDPVVQLIKKASAFSSWGGKRSNLDSDPTEESDDYELVFPVLEPENEENHVLKKSFSSWGGKRAFSNWGGKRIPNQEKPRRAFSSWGGKRAFSTWGGKREPPLHEVFGEAETADKRSFASWGGKRKFSSWGGKRNALEGIDKKTFSSWGGKRQLPCTNCNNVFILAPDSYRSSPNDKNLSIISFSMEDNGQIPEIFKDNKEEKDYSRHIHHQNVFQSEKEESELLKALDHRATTASPLKDADINSFLQDNMHHMKKRDGRFSGITKHLTYPSIVVRGRFSSWGGKRALKPLANQLSKTASPQTLERQYRRGGEFYAWGG